MNVNQRKGFGDGQDTRQPRPLAWAILSAENALSCHDSLFCDLVVSCGSRAEKAYHKEIIT